MEALIDTKCLSSVLTLAEVLETYSGDSIEVVSWVKKGKGV